MGAIVDKHMPATVNPQGKILEFGQMVETVKDAFVIEIQKFFNARSRLLEIPNIEKFHFEDPQDLESDDQLLTWTHIIMQYPDLTQRLPLIAITTAAGLQRKLSFGTQFVGVYWKVSEIRTGTFEPFALEGGLILNFETDRGENSLTFGADGFVNINSVLAAELAEYINFYAPDLQAFVYTTTVDDEERRGVAFQPIKTVSVPSFIEIRDSGDLNTIFGIVADTRDDSNDHPPLNRFYYSMNLNVGLDVGAESENTRKELMDLLIVFMQFYMVDRDFQFFGAANMPDQNGEIIPQPFQIILGESQSKSGEAEIPRPEGDGTQKIFVDRYVVPVTMFQFVDRPVIGPDQGVVSSFIDP